MELFIRYFKNFPVRNGEGGQMGKITYAMGGRSKRTCAYDGGRWGQIFDTLVRTC